MRNFLKLLLLAPIVVIFLSFDMANRQNVLISFDPFNSDDAPWAHIEVPLFIVLMAAAMLGVLFGGVATWLEQGRFRKAAGEANARLQNLRRENESLRGQIKAAKAPGSAASTSVTTTRSAA